MEIVSGFLIVGLIMTLAGAILIFISLRASPQEILGDSDEVSYFGSIPMVVKDGRKWILIALIISVVFLSYIIVKTTFPSIFGGF
jgi:hypothetical protein